MKVKVDQDTCIGCGMCTGIAEGVFEISDSGKAAVVKQPDAGQEANAKNAMESCPVSAISEE
jgi:ferredoxin